MKDIKIKIIVGFRQEQHYTIDAEEAHKAYYLFLNPEKRGVFNNGVALIGKNIQGIEPDYQSTMGWNTTHVLDSNDWNEIRAKGIDIKIRDVLQVAKQIAQSELPEKMNIQLSKLEPKLLQDGAIEEI